MLKHRSVGNETPDFCDFTAGRITIRAPDFFVRSRVLQSSILGWICPWKQWERIKVNLRPKDNFQKQPHHQRNENRRVANLHSNGRPRLHPMWPKSIPKTKFKKPGMVRNGLLLFTSGTMFVCPKQPIVPPNYHWHFGPFQVFTAPLRNNKRNVYYFMAAWT